MGSGGGSDRHLVPVLMEENTLFLIILGHIERVTLSSNFTIDGVSLD